jgi:hypothetical protein
VPTGMSARLGRSATVESGGPRPSRRDYTSVYSAISKAELDAEIADSAFKLGVTEEELDSTEVLGPADRLTSVWCGAMNGCHRPPGQDQSTLPRMPRSENTAGSKDPATQQRGSETETWSGRRCAAAIQPATASRVCSVISNCTGRWVFFWHDEPVAATGRSTDDSGIEIRPIFPRADLT